MLPLEHHLLVRPVNPQIGKLGLAGAERVVRLQHAGAGPVRVEDAPAGVGPVVHVPVDAPIKRRTAIERDLRERNGLEAARVEYGLVKSPMYCCGLAKPTVSAMPCDSTWFLIVTFHRSAPSEKPAMSQRPPTVHCFRRLRFQAGVAGEPVGAGEQVVLRASGDAG